MSLGHVQVSDYKGAPQTVALMIRSAREAQLRPEVREMVERIAERVASKDVLSEALAIYYFVLSSTRYMRDQRNVELVRAPWVVIGELMQGRVPCLDCDDMATLICALSLSAGHECRIVTVAFEHMFFGRERQYSHVFAQSREPRSGAWITLDPVAGAKTLEMQRRVVAAKCWPVA